MRLKVITKADIILAVVLLVLGLGSPFLLAKNGENDVAVITMDGQILGSYELEENIILVVSESGIKEISLKDAESIISQHKEASFLSQTDEHILFDGEEVLNIVEINDGKAEVIFATCSGQDCVKMGEIDKTGDVIACLPHRLLVTIESKDNGNSPDVVLK